MSALKKAKEAIATAAAGKAAYELLVSVEGQPVRKRDQPAVVKIAGITVFRRDSELNRYLFWIPLGKRK
jgi:hypothetical protein